MVNGLSCRFIAQPMQLSVTNAQVASFASSRSLTLLPAVHLEHRPRNRNPTHRRRLSRLRHGSPQPKLDTLVDELGGRIIAVGGDVASLDDPRSIHMVEMPMAAVNAQNSLFARIRLDVIKPKDDNDCAVFCVRG